MENRPEDVIDAYGALVERACSVFGFVDNAEFARLRIEGDTAYLSSTHAVSDYDCCIDETDTRTFPAEVLSMSEKHFAQWLAEVKAGRERQWAAEVAQRAAEQQRQELIALAALKAKYEGA